jgi:hypothetical protein
MNPAEHNHVKKLLRLTAEGKLAFCGSGLWHLEVRHDDWCGFHRGRLCNCDPEFWLHPQDDGCPKRIE